MVRTYARGLLLKKSKFPVQFVSYAELGKCAMLFHSNQTIDSIFLYRYIKEELIMNEYGYLKFHIEDILKEKGISKNRMCLDLRLQRTQLNNYCKGLIQRIDVNTLCHMCQYLNCSIGDLIEYCENDIPK